VSNDADGVVTFELDTSLARILPASELASLA